MLGVATAYAFRPEFGNQNNVSNRVISMRSELIVITPFVFARRVLARRSNLMSSELLIMRLLRQEPANDR